MRNVLPILILLAAMGINLPQPAHARTLDSDCALFDLRRSSGKSQAAAQAKSRHGGKVLSVSESSSQSGGKIYRVKLLLDSGRVKIVTIRGK